MAAEVEVHITDRAIISALNTPGGDVFKWRDDVAVDTVRIAIGMSPVNDVLDALHRGGVVGTYKASWGFDRVGSNGHRVQATIYNGADHADIVEFGRRRSWRSETFAWTGHRPPGAISTHEHGTAARNGRHILRDATAVAVGAAVGGGSFSFTA